MARRQYISSEHKRLVQTYGKWYEVNAGALGSVCVRELCPASALPEAAERLGVEVDQLKDAVVTELAS